MRTSAFFRQKNFGFFEMFSVSARTRGRGFSQCRHFSDKEGGVNFSQFCPDIFYGRPLIGKTGVQIWGPLQCCNCKRFATASSSQMLLWHYATEMCVCVCVCVFYPDPSEGWEPSISK